MQKGKADSVCVPNGFDIFVCRSELDPHTHKRRQQYHNKPQTSAQHRARAQINRDDDDNNNIPVDVLVLVLYVHVCVEYPVAHVSPNHTEVPIPNKIINIINTYVHTYAIRSCVHSAHNTHTHKHTRIYV